MRKLVREPLLHFLIFGVIIYMASPLWSEPGITTSPNIVVSEGQVVHLATLFQKKWQRPPRRAELEDLVQEFVLEEGAYREGIARGIDRDDAVIRRRIRQKLNFIIEDSLNYGDISKADLRAYYKENAGMFRDPPKITFKHIYLDPNLRGADMANKVRGLLDRLAENPQMDTMHIGDASMLDHTYSAITPYGLSKLFGREFSAKIIALDTGKWRGPIASSFGVYLVFIKEHVEGRLPQFGDIEYKIRAELENFLRRENLEDFYTNLLKRYNVIIEWPENESKYIARNNEI